MSFDERKTIYAEIEEIRGRPLIAYVTNNRPGAQARIASDAVREFLDQLRSLPTGTKNLDVLINSTGGDGLTSWRIVSLVREYLPKDGQFSVLVPHYAFSAATLLALGADEIVMHKSACLGPVDPQITVTSKDGTQGFAYEDVIAFANFLKEEGGITEQSHLTPLLEHVVKEIRPSILGASKRSSSQSVTMAKKLLQMHMKGADSAKAEVIAEKLNKSFFSHGHAVSRSEAMEMGLKIAESNPDLEEKIWLLFIKLEEDLKMRIPFNPLQEILKNPASSFLLAPPPQVPIPGNAPIAVQNQIWNNYLAGAQTNQAPTLDYELIIAVMESARSGSRFVIKGKMFAARKPDLDYLVGTPATYSQWENQ